VSPSLVGIRVGTPVGDDEGPGSVGDSEGFPVRACVEGAGVAGDAEGAFVGVSVVGEAVGSLVLQVIHSKFVGPVQQLQAGLQAEHAHKPFTKPAY
jgi:hypothetical protein